MSSPVLIYSTEVTSTPVPGSTTGNLAYAPTITSLRGEVTSLEAITTLGVMLGTLIFFVLADSLQFWMLESGNADGTDPTASLQPLDYDAALNNVHLQKVGGY